MIPIEKNVPIPERAVGPKTKYPFASMQIGDSFFIPGMEKFTYHWYPSKKYGHTYRSKKVDGGMRIWRIA